MNGGYFHYTDMNKFLKNLWNYWSDFEIMSKKCSLSDPFQKLFAKFWSVNKHGISEWGLLALYEHKEILVNSSLKVTKKNWLRSSQKFRWAIQALLSTFFLILYRAFWTFSSFSNKPWFLHVCCTSFLKNSLQAISPFLTVFSIHLENFLPFSANLNLSSANSFNLEESKICPLGKG